MSTSEFKFGPWRVSADRRLIEREGEHRQLDPVLMRLLEVLAAAEGRVVTKDELRRQVWTDVVVADTSIWGAVSRLRKELDDNPSHPLYVETVAGRGYRATKAALHPSASSAQVPTTDRHFLRWLPSKAATALATGLLLAALGTVVPFSTAPSAEDKANASNVFGQGPHDLQPELLHARGVDLYSQYSYPENRKAIEFFELAVERQMPFAAASASLADAYLRNWMAYGESPSDRRWMKAALTTARRAVDEAPSLGSAQRAHANALMASGELDAAVSAYLEAIRLDPTDAAAKHNLAQLRFSQGQLDQAIPLLLEVERNAAPEGQLIARYSLARAYVRLGDLETAEQMAESLLGEHPEPARVAALLVRIQLLLGRKETALALARRSLSDWPRSPRLLAVAALAADVNGDIAAARSLLARASSDSLSRISDDVWLRHASLELRRGERSTGERYLARIEANAAGADRSPLDRSGLVRIAAVAALRGDLQLAKERLDEASALGFVDYRCLSIDPMYTSLRSIRNFSATLAQQRRSLESQRLELARPETIEVATTGLPGAS